MNERVLGRCGEKRSRGGSVDEKIGTCIVHLLKCFLENMVN